MVFPFTYWILLVIPRSPFTFVEAFSENLQFLKYLSSANVLTSLIGVCQLREVL
jgi:hypothetical protein